LGSPPDEIQDCAASHKRGTQIAIGLAKLPRVGTSAVITITIHVLEVVVVVVLVLLYLLIKIWRRI
jgi:hypothetical protein